MMSITTKTLLDLVQSHGPVAVAESFALVVSTARLRAERRKDQPMVEVCSRLERALEPWVPAAIDA